MLRYDLPIGSTRFRRLSRVFQRELFDWINESTFPLTRQEYWSQVSGQYHQEEETSRSQETESESPLRIELFGEWKVRELM